MPAVLAGAFLLSGCGSQNDTSDTAKNAGPASSGNLTPAASMGEQIFRRCVACHTIEKGGANGIGPNLHAIVGRPVASHAGFAYSAAMRAHGGNWDAATLDSFLADPMKNLPGSRMVFAGVIDPADRKALILYLEEQS